MIMALKRNGAARIHGAGAEAQTRRRARADAERAQPCATTSDTSDTERAPLLRRREMPSHPKGLYVLYATELWERFSFYGMKALLVLYLNSGALSPERLPNMLGSSVVVSIFGQPTTPQQVQALSSMLNELYSGAAYLMPLAGGALADACLGARRTMLLGGVLMAAGHGCLVSEKFFLVGLVLLVLGNGGFKPNISSQLGALYEPPGPTALRDRGFAIFYTGINVGALLAPLVCGALQEASGFHAGFGVAGIGMLVGLASYLIGARWLPPEPRRRGSGAAVPPRRRAGGVAAAAGAVAACNLPARRAVLGSVRAGGQHAAALLSRPRRGRCSAPRCPPRGCSR